MRQIARQAGLIAYLQILTLQAAFLNPDQSDAAFDSELALLWWPAYPRAGWQANPLRASTGAPDPRLPPVVMVARLDGPNAQVVKRMIETSAAVEQAGLQGRLVLDSRGIPLRDGNGTSNGYGIFDELLRKLAGFANSRTRVSVHLDEHADVIQPTAPVDDVALYCGWYSVSKYVPGMKFNPGAIGMHVASFTLAGLHGPYDGDWCRALLADGCVATCGAVSEPLLTAFPQPDEFFPLLMTGRVTLAEAYWRTLPVVSWKMCLLGDPLYTPYRARPGVRVRDLPAGLQGVFSDAPVDR
jgi:uncharacterized protein (TIGR03790 family)